MIRHTRPSEVRCKWRPPAETEPAGTSAHDTPVRAARTPEQPSHVVILTHPGGQRMLSSASLMTEAVAEAEAASWRRTRPAGSSEPWSAEVCRAVPATEGAAS